MRIFPFSLLSALALMFALPSPALAEKILTITSEPSGATVSINGQVAGVTPIQEKVKEFWFNGPKYLWSEFLNQPIQLTVGKEGYEPQTITITSGPYRWVNLNNTAEKIYYVINQQSIHVVLHKVDPLRGKVPVAVSSEPAGAEIRVDGSFEGSTPSKILLQPGAHTITVTRPGFKPWQRVINVEPNSEKTLNALLEAEGPNARPPGATYAAAAPNQPSQAASGKPELVVGSGHSSGVYALTFSPDEKLLASGDGGGVIKLWDGRSGVALRTLTEAGILTQGEPSIRALAFSPDGTVLASATTTNSESEEGVVARKTDIILWDVSSGKPVGALQGLEGSYTSLAFSPDGSVLAGGRADEILTPNKSEAGVTLWDLKSGQEVAKLPAAIDASVLIFTPDGKQLLAGNWVAGHRLWTLPDGGYKEMAGLPILRDRSPWISVADLNPYVKKFAVAKRSTDNDVIQNPKQNVVIVLDASGTKLLKELKWDGGEYQWVTAVRFSPTGKSLACADIEGRVKVWDTETWDETASVPKGESSNVIAMSPNSKVLAFSSEDSKVIKLWDLNDETMMKVLGGDTGHKKEITALAFSPDSRTLASGSDDNMVKLWDVETGRVKTLAKHTTTIQDFAFSPNGKVLVTVATYDESEDELDKGIVFWAVESGTVLKSITPSSPPASIGFSPDGALLAVGNTDKTISIYDAATGRMVRTLTGLIGEVKSVMFVNGQTMQSVSIDDEEEHSEIKLWNVASGELMNTVTDKTIDPNAVVFMGNMGGTLAVSDKLYASPLPGGGFDLFSKSTTQMMDFSPQSEVAKLYLLGDNDWLITTPEGLFDGSPGGWKRASWRFNGNTFDNSALELYFRDFFHPNLLQEIIAGKTPKPPGGLDLAKFDRRQPSVLISEINGETNLGFEGRRAAGFRTDKRIASVTITVADNVEEPKQSGKAATSGAQDLRLFRNGSLVRIWRGDLFGLGEGDGCTQLAPSKQGEPRRVRCRADVPVVAGDNGFSAYAFNREKVKSEDSTFPVVGADALKRERTLYVVAVGVGQYENPEFNLKYTVRDAQNFGEEVRRQQEAVGFYQKVEVIPLLDQSARKDFILSALNTLKEAAQPEDGLIIYFSGHGVARGDRFYLLPSNIGYKGPRSALDDAAMQTILAHGISDLELESALTSIDAGRILLVIDACYSGKALQADDERRGPMNTNGLGQLAYEKGMYVLTASQGEEAAYESAALKHSYLTYALVEEGLKANEADADGDGQLLLGEWLEYAKRRVPRMRRGQTVGTAARPNKSLEEAGAPEEESVVQRPRVFYRREPELQPFVVAKPGARAPVRSAKEGAR